MKKTNFTAEQSLRPPLYNYADRSGSVSVRSAFVTARNSPQESRTNKVCGNCDGCWSAGVCSGLREGQECRGVSGVCRKVEDCPGGITACCGCFSQ